MAAARSEKIGYGLGDMSSSMFWKNILLLSSVFLLQHFRVEPGTCRRTVARHQTLGRGIRSRHGPDRRPYDLPLGTLPTLPALGRRSFRRGRHPHLYDTHVELFGQTDMGLRHLLADDDRLHRHQRPLWGDAGRGDRRFARTDGILLLPDVFRLRGQLPGTGDFRTPVRPLHPRHRGHGRRAGPSPRRPTDGRRP